MSEKVTVECPQCGARYHLEVEHEMPFFSLLFRYLGNLMALFVIFILFLGGLRITQWLL